MKMKNDILCCKNLQEGMVVKNYKEMCSLLNEPVCEGNSKKYQVKDWERYFDYSKEGQKFIINEVFEEPFPSLDARKQRDSLYVKYIELLLLDYLSHCNGAAASLTKNQWYNLLGLTNNFYTLEMKSSKNAETREIVVNDKHYTVTRYDMLQFYQRTGKKLNDILMKALRSMSNRCMILYRPEIIYMVFEYGHEVWKVADYEKASAVLKIYRKTLLELGCNSLTEMILNGLEKEFDSRKNAEVKELLGWEKCYQQLTIVHMQDIASQIPLQVEDIRKLSTKVQRQCLNNNTVMALYQQIENRYKKNMEEYKKYEDSINGKPVADIEPPFRYESNYIEVQKALTDYLIKFPNNVN